MKRHINIPIFVPHLGCPHQCSFCNQRAISGQSAFSLEEMEKTVQKTLETAQDAEVEIAFFGGSFTGIARPLMIEILSRVQPYLDSGRVSALRCSTRPDYINEEIIEILLSYGVKTVELGIQSMSDAVLRACHRGHTAEQSVHAAELLCKSGIRFVGQMMVGLPMASAESERKTAAEICRLGAVGARVYPTVVFRKTPLCEAAESGEYQPLALSEATRRAADCVEIFRASGVKLLRVGLQASEALSDPSEVFGGPVHSALGELVESEIYRRKIVSLLEKEEKRAPCLRIFVAKGCISAAAGHNRANKTYLAEHFGFRRVIVEECDFLARGDIKIKTEERKRLCT